MPTIADASVQLIVTSPPYPMIAMWDRAFGEMNPKIAQLLEEERGNDAFNAMHEELNHCWRECYRTLIDGGLACINIGDATRSMGGQFALYPNHAAIVTALQSIGFTILPDILWRKPSNAPNKYMGSGMLPAGAYVTYEHEYVIIARKGGKRIFKTAEEKSNRRRSAFFWEERNAWFSDLWQGLTGSRQKMGPKGPRERSAAFPLDLPQRLILMHSVYGDTVLDPFLGTGTTAAAAMRNGRNSIGIERTKELETDIENRLAECLSSSKTALENRIDKHTRFIESRIAMGKIPKHHNDSLETPVITKQERELSLSIPRELKACGENRRICSHVYWTTS